MMKAHPDFSALRDALFRKAALAQAFSPSALLAQVVNKDQSADIFLKGQLLSALREQCTTLGEQWQMRPLPRRRELSTLTKDDALGGIESEIVDALKGQGAFSATALQLLLDGEPDNSTDQTQQLSAVVTTLEQAGPNAQGHAHLLELSNKLDRKRREAATDALLDGVVVGRDAEVKRLIAALDAPQNAAPLTTFHIQGLPGVGKTFLLEELSRLCRENPRIVMIRLDFDRTPLKYGDTRAVIEEISRQVGIALPKFAKKLHALRLKDAELQTRSGPQSSGYIPFELLDHTISLLSKQDIQVLILLDTLEVLHGNGATFIDRLMDDIDRYASKGQLNISVISAGRGPVFPEGHKRLRELIELDRLDAEVSRAILSKKGVPKDLHDRILRIADGNPLRLVLAATRALDGTMDDAEADVSTGYLYRAILSRVPETIREIAAEGLILPYIGLFELTHIIGPALDIPIDESRANEIMEQLEAQRWLVQRVGNGLAHVDDARREILERIYAERVENTGKINAVAANILQDRDPLRALYHRLQLTRGGTRMPGIDPELARQMSGTLLEELPPKAQDAVRRARGQRSRVQVDKSFAKSDVSAAQSIQSESMSTSDVTKITVTASEPLNLAATSYDAKPQYWLYADPDTPSGRLKFVKLAIDGNVGVDSGALADMRNMLASRELREASHLLNHEFSTPFALDSEAGVLAITHQWLTGHWSVARQLFLELPKLARYSALRDDRELTGFAILEMWAEFDFDDLCDTIQSDRYFAESVNSAVARTQRNGLREGALSFALLASYDQLDPKSGKVPDVLARYLLDTPAYGLRDLQERSNALRDGLGLNFKGGKDDPSALTQADYARLVAPLNPYAAPLHALIQDLSGHENMKVFKDLHGFLDILPELAELFSPQVLGAHDAQKRVGGKPEDTLVLLNVLGLSAEFARGYSFFSPIADLPTLARAAERWQQATLGLWRYGRHQPPNWQGGGVDVLVLERANHIIDAPNSPDLALRLLHIWDDPLHQPEARSPAMLMRRLAPIYATLGQCSILEECLQQLQRSTIAQVLHAPVAALSVLGVPAEKIFYDPS